MEHWTIAVVYIQLLFYHNIYQLQPHSSCPQEMAQQERSVLMGVAVVRTQLSHNQRPSLLHVVNGVPDSSPCAEQEAMACFG